MPDTREPLVGWVEPGGYLYFTYPGVLMSYTPDELSRIGVLGCLADFVAWLISAGYA